MLSSKREAQDFFTRHEVWPPGCPAPSPLVHSAFIIGASSPAIVSGEGKPIGGGGKVAMMGGFGGIGMVLWIGLIVAAIWWITQATTNQTNQRATNHRLPESEAPRQLLDERLARGEVTIEQYRELKKALER
jgi:uncharacterized membrane protein